MNQDNARRTLASLLADANIRTDQCDIVRVYWRDICGGIRPLPGGGFHVTAGDSREQEDNITFEPSYSGRFDDEDVAIVELVSAYKCLDLERG